MPELAAATLLTAYGLLCVYCWRLGRQRSAPSANPAGLLIGYASQSGRALQKARAWADQLAEAGLLCNLAPLNAITAPTLQGYSRALFVVSTYGEGESPDNASQFLPRILKSSLSLHHLEFALVALGDSRYRHFCGFAHRLRQALCQCGARLLGAPIELDAAQPDTAWQQALNGLWGQGLPLGATTRQIEVPPEQHHTQSTLWRLQERQVLNPGSRSAPLVRVVLRPEQPAFLNWHAGDTASILVPGADHPRRYTIASLPAQGYLELIVRQRQLTDGNLGLASGWLTHQAPLSSQVPLQLMPTALAPLALERPWILLAAGSGLAGLLAQLRRRADTGHKQLCWVIYGERCSRQDVPCADLLARWLEQGVITHLDKTFSADIRTQSYVQDCLCQQSERLYHWLSQGAQVYLCGSAQGLGQGVNATLEDLLGRERCLALLAQGDIIRDVY